MANPLPCPNHLSHNYTFPEFALTDKNGSNQQPYFRVMLFFNKKPGLTDEFFHAHWKSVHADLTMQVDGAGVDFVRYVQFHQEQTHIDALAPLLVGNTRMVRWDGAAEFWTESADKFVEFMQKLYASDKLVGCGSRFVDLVEGYSVMAGYDNLIFGPGVPGMGNDGVMKGDERLARSVVVGKEEKVGIKVEVMKVDDEEVDNGTEEVLSVAVVV